MKDIHDQADETVEAAFSKPLSDYVLAFNALERAHIMLMRLDTIPPYMLKDLRNLTGFDIYAIKAIVDTTYARIHDAYINDDDAEAAA